MFELPETPELPDDPSTILIKMKTWVIIISAMSLPERNFLNVIVDIYSKTPFANGDLVAAFKSIMNEELPIRDRMSLLHSQINTTTSNIIRNTDEQNTIKRTMIAFEGYLMMGVGILYSNITGFEDYPDQLPARMECLACLMEVYDLDSIHQEITNELANYVKSTQKDTP